MVPWALFSSRERKLFHAFPRERKNHLTLTNTGSHSFLQYCDDDDDDNDLMILVQVIDMMMMTITHQIMMMETLFLGY